MQFFPKEDYKKPLYAGAYILLLFIFIYIFSKYLFKPLLPFLLAFCIVLSLRPLINTVSKKTKMPKRPVGITVVFTVTAFVFSFLSFTGEKIFSELQALAVYLSENGDRIINDIFSFLDSLEKKLPFLDKLYEGNNEHLRSLAVKALGSFVNNATSALPDKLYHAIMSIPDIIFFVIVLILSSVYVCADYDKISDLADEKLPKGFMEGFKKIKSNLKDTAFKYIKAYLFLIFITFSELLCGFLILKIDYAFLLAVSISLIDVLPILGVGTVLAPWAAVLFLTGNKFLATGLLIMYGVITLVRQFTEPHIVGKSFGIHPLIMLISMYSGYKICGITGLILFPVTAAMLYAPFSKNNQRQ